MTVVCNLHDSRLDNNDDDVLVVTSEFGRDVKLTFKGQTIQVNGYELKKAVDNCCNT